MITNIPKIKNKLLGNKSLNISIISHVNPDGDAVGSSLSLCQILKKKNHNVRVITPSVYPDFLNWLDDSKEVINAMNDVSLAEQVLLDSNIIFCVDFNSISRAGNLSDALNRSKAFKILIDHHISPESFADFIFSDTKYASTAEMVYEFIISIGLEHLIDKSIARTLYVGIITDTGNFSYPNTTASTHLIASKLINLGIDISLINSNIYQSFSESRMRMLGHALFNRFKVFSDRGCSYLYLTKEDHLNFNYKDGDTEGMVNYGLSIKGVNMSAIFIEKEDHIKVSLRSKGAFDVNQFARSNFNGGGHKNAAGGQLYCSLAKALVIFDFETELLKEEILNS